jgi:dethiobiotin synthetase
VDTLIPFLAFSRNIPMTVKRPLELLIAGTGTDVGKTYFSRLLVAGLRTQGRRVWVQKPIACGAKPGMEDGEDAVLWRSFADPDQPPKSACPWSFPETSAPSWILRQRQISCTITDLARGITALRGDHDLIVEGAGGLLSPLSSDDGNLTDLARATGLPLLLVGSTCLGCINACLLSIREIKRHKLPLLGLILSDTVGTKPFVPRTELRRLLEKEVPLLGIIEHRATHLAATCLAAIVNPEKTSALDPASQRG